jgi:hypothetical protein
LRAFTPATAAMSNHTIPLFSFPAAEGKKVIGAFGGGRMSSDRGVMPLSRGFSFARLQNMGGRMAPAARGVQ